jgi:apolipoprotein N-acyltransferase
MIKGLAGKIASLSGWRRALVAFISGAIATLTQPPFDIFIAGFIAFPLLVWLMDGAVPDANKGPIKRFFPVGLIGWWFGFGYFVSGLWWIGSALLVDARQFAWAIPLAVLGLPAFLAIF